MNSERWLGLVLAGGRSSRFGGEKAVALLHGRPLMTWCADALGDACSVVAVNIRRGGETETLAHSLGLDVIFDDPNYPVGPLAGVAAGLVWAEAPGFDGLVTLPCDTPLVGATQIEILIAALGDAPAAYAVGPNGPHPLCAVWRTRLAADVAAALAGADHPPVRDFLAKIGARAVYFDEARSFWNVNRPEDLARLEAAL